MEIPGVPPEQSRQDAVEVKPPAKVEIYTNRFSPDCIRAKGLLDRLGVTYNEFIIDDDEIKLTLAGHGHADKDEVLSAVMRELDLCQPPRPDDAADALAAALTGWLQR